MISLCHVCILLKYTRQAPLSSDLKEKCAKKDLLMPLKKTFKSRVSEKQAELIPMSAFIAWGAETRAVTRWSLTTDEAIQGIDTGRWTFFTVGGGRRGPGLLLHGTTDKSTSRRGGWD